MVLVLSMATHPSTRIHVPGLSGPLGLTSRPTLPTRRRRTVLTVHIASAKAANEALAAAGEEPDWLGDAVCNDGEHSSRNRTCYGFLT